MGYFVEVSIAQDQCLGLKDCGACVRVCPVNIFEKDGQRPRVATANEDECILCDQCRQECAPGAITIAKKY